MRERITKAILEERCNKKYGIGKFSYEKTVFNKVHDIAIITCVKHGDFKHRIYSHMCHNGCRKCNQERLQTLRIMSQETVLKRFVLKHGSEFDYSKVIYKGMHERVNVICRKHGEFKIFPQDHQKGVKCSKCRKLKKYTIETLIEAFIELYGDKKYDYSLIKEYRNNKQKIPIRCIEHDFIFFMKSNDHLNNHGCSKCAESKGEKEVERICKDLLNIKNIDSQRVYDDMINPLTGYQLSFDKHLPDFNTLIEYQGEYHHKPITYQNGKVISEQEATELFKYQQYRDQLKRDFCKKNNIKLIEIDYWDYYNIESILRRELNLERKDNAK